MLVDPSTGRLTAVSRPCQKGELALIATSSGSPGRMPSTTRMASSSESTSMCVCIAQTNAWRASSPYSAWILR